MKSSLKSLFDKQSSINFRIRSLAEARSIEFVNKVLQTSVNESEKRKLISGGIQVIGFDYGQQLSEATSEFYTEQRMQAGIRDSFVAKPLTYSETLSLRREASISTTVLMKEVTVQGLGTGEFLFKAGSITGNTVQSFHTATVVSNSKRDNKYKSSARQPSPTACAYCLLKASQFAPYGDELDHIILHKDCRCVAGVLFKTQKEKDLSGYRVDEFSDKYESAEKGFLQLENNLKRRQAYSGNISSSAIKSIKSFKENMSSKDYAKLYEETVEASEGLIQRLKSKASTVRKQDKLLLESFGLNVSRYEEMLNLEVATGSKENTILKMLRKKEGYR